VSNVPTDKKGWSRYRRGLSILHKKLREKLSYIFVLNPPPPPPRNFQEERYRSRKVGIRIKTISRILGFPESEREK
jgi:hypothetical protein